MSLFRSAPMKFYSLHIPKQFAYEVVSRIGQDGFAHFIDAQPNSFTKPFHNSVRRVEQINVKVNTIIRQLLQGKIHLPDVPLVQKVFQKINQYLLETNMTSLALLDQIQDEVDAKFHNLEKLKRNIGQFESKIQQFQDQKHLLFKAREVFHSQSNEKSSEQNKFSLQQLRLASIAGVIPIKHLTYFTRMIFRASKGNSILYTFNIPQEGSSENESEARAAFIIVVEHGDILMGKLHRICDTFGVNKHKIPSGSDKIFEKIKQIQTSIVETKQLLMMTKESYVQEMAHCVEISQFGCGRFDGFKILLQKELLIFQTMNLLEQVGNILIGKVWVPEDKVGKLLSGVPTVVSIRLIQHEEKPPTFFEMNQFTAPFQQIVNTYGIPRYQEVNPALYAIPIFPFLFGVMFGDIGHGGALLAFAIWLCNSETAKIKLRDVYAIRYLLLMMGMCAFYSGWIYNQFFSLPINVFGTCYQHAQPQEYAAKQQGCVYPFGFDPKWFRASNELNYFNSYKMKFAVIIGVLQMTFGIFLKMLNTSYFRNYIDLFFEWLPQQIFFFCTFGYMCFLILFKWTIPWGIERSTHEAPSIIGQMIALPLQLGSTQGKPLWDMQSQQSLQYNFLILSLICVPWMLIPKPLILWLTMPKSSNSHKQAEHDITQDNLNQKLNATFENQQIQAQGLDMIPVKRQSQKSHHGHQSHDHDISEIAVHQIIETIEFILGSISNTASYLRLWALSLAHGQLSKVFLQKTIGGGIQSANIIVIIIGMYLFVNITLGVIMGMDSMQCFLHALRLQWVEFQSKFFKADGWKFVPLTFAQPVETKVLATRNVD